MEESPERLSFQHVSGGDPFELSVKPLIDDHLRQLGTDDPGAEGQNIGVIIADGTAWPSKARCIPLRGCR